MTDWILIIGCSSSWHYRGF